MLILTNLPLFFKPRLNFYLKSEFKISFASHLAFPHPLLCDSKIAQCGVHTVDWFDESPFLMTQKKRNSFLIHLRFSQKLMNNELIALVGFEWTHKSEKIDNLLLKIEEDLNTTSETLSKLL